MPELSTHRDGDVAVVRWSGGENRFRDDTVAEWHAALDALEGTDGPLALVLTGEGKYFSNGLDLEWMSAHPDRSGDVVAGVHRLLGRLLALDAVVVAAVNGHAFAAGAMLTAACDVRVMREDRGWWCLPEVHLGLPLTEPMYAVVATGLPRAAVVTSVLEGRRFTGPEALAAGIVHELVAADDVVDRAVERARELATGDRGVIGVHKRQLHAEALAVLEAHA